MLAARRLGVCFLLPIAACGGGGGSVDVDVDAAPGDGPGADASVAPACDWPIDTATQAGTIELGTGTGSFEPMPEEISFVVGTQGGTFLVVHSRIKDLDPGSADDFLDPRNPRTRFSATLFDGTVVGRECPSTQAYRASADGFFERKAYDALEFLPFELGEGAFDTTVTLKVEIIDADGKHASDEEDVFCRAPDGWRGDAGVPVR